MAGSKIDKPIPPAKKLATVVVSFGNSITKSPIFFFYPAKKSVTTLITGSKAVPKLIPILWIEFPKRVILFAVVALLASNSLFIEPL